MSNNIPSESAIRSAMRSAELEPTKSEPIPPVAVKIGYRVFKIEPHWDAVEASASSRMGESSVSTATIRIRADGDPAWKCETLIHEILHMAAHVYGLFEDNHAKLGDLTEERLVTVAAPLLLQIWIDNPGLRRYMAEVAAWHDPKKPDRP